MSTDPDRERRRYRARARGRQPHSVREGRAVVHSLPIGYALDDKRGIRDPRGMVGSQLGVDMHVVTTDVARRAQSHAAGRALPSSPSRRWSRLPTCPVFRCWPTTRPISARRSIDIGAGTTTMRGLLRAAASSMSTASRSAAITSPWISRAGSPPRSPMPSGSRRCSASALSGPSDERDMIIVAGGRRRSARAAAHRSPRAQLVRIIRPRVEEILEMVRDRLDASPFAADPRGRVVLTGGASQLTGLAGSRRADARPAGAHRPPARHRRPAEAAKGPAFAAAAGLLVYPQFAYLEHFEPRRTRQLMTGTDGYITRVGRWLRESF